MRRIGRRRGGEGIRGRARTPDERLTRVPSACYKKKPSALFAALRETHSPALREKDTRFRQARKPDLRGWPCEKNNASRKDAKTQRRNREQGRTPDERLTRVPSACYKKKPSALFAALRETHSPRLCEKYTLRENSQPGKPDLREMTSSPSRCVFSRNRLVNSRSTERSPVPIVRPSISTTGANSPIVPVQNASSAR